MGQRDGFESAAPILLNALKRSELARVRFYVIFFYAPYFPERVLGDRISHWSPFADSPGGLLPVCFFSPLRNRPASKPSVSLAHFFG